MQNKNYSKFQTAEALSREFLPKFMLNHPRTNGNFPAFTPPVTCYCSCKVLTDFLNFLNSCVNFFYNFPLQFESFGWNIHHVKSVRIRNFSGPYFPAFKLNTEIRSMVTNIIKRIIPKYFCLIFLPINEDAITWQWINYDQRKLTKISIVAGITKG